MDGSTPKEQNFKNYILPTDWSRLSLETDSSLYIDRSFLLNSMRQHNIASGNMDTIGNLIDFIELTTSQCCQVLGIEESPTIRVVPDQLIQGKYKLKGGHFQNAKISIADTEYDTWLIDITVSDLEEIAKWWSSSAKTSSYWRKYFEARLAKTIGHEAAHHKLVLLYPELDTLTVSAADDLKSGNDLSYRGDPGENLARNFDKTFLQKRVEYWERTKGNMSDIEFYNSEIGEYVEAWQGYLTNDYDRS